jgi:hypothetical protein
MLEVLGQMITNMGHELHFPCVPTQHTIQIKKFWFIEITLSLTSPKKGVCQYTLDVAKGGVFNLASL